MMGYANANQSDVHIRMTYAYFPLLVSPCPTDPPNMRHVTIRPGHRGLLIRSEREQEGEWERERA